ncbi:hypothetical protein PENSPDRAFT_232831 [Peniophora sp. CONT]|nr:hypothetical protein PENSPDRAFT_232831 [Peniophora sp. CONT]
MLPRIVTIAVLAAASPLAAAAPASDNIPPLLCNPANLYCCSEFVDVGDITPAIDALLILLGINPNSIVSPIGLTCNTETPLEGLSCQGTNACCGGTNLVCYSLSCAPEFCFSSR